MLGREAEEYKEEEEEKERYHIEPVKNMAALVSSLILVVLVCWQGGMMVLGGGSGKREGTITKARSPMLWFYCFAAVGNLAALVSTCMVTGCRDGTSCLPVLGCD